MFAIVMWEVDSKFSIIGLKTIIEPRQSIADYIVGENVTAPYKGKPLLCRLFEIGELRATLKGKLDDGYQLDLEVLLGSSKTKSSDNHPVLEESSKKKKSDSHPVVEESSKKKKTDSRPVLEESSEKKKSDDHPVLEECSKKRKGAVLEDTSRKRKSDKGKENAKKTTTSMTSSNKNTKDTSMSDEYPEDISLAKKILQMRRKTRQPLTTTQDKVYSAIHVQQSGPDPQSYHPSFASQTPVNSAPSHPSAIVNPAAVHSPASQTGANPATLNFVSQTPANSAPHHHSAIVNPAAETSVHSPVSQTGANLATLNFVSQTHVNSAPHHHSAIVNPAAETSIHSHVFQTGANPAAVNTTANNPVNAATRANGRVLFNSESHTPVFVGNHLPSYEHSPSYHDLSTDHTADSFLGALSDAMDTVYNHKQFSSSCHDCCSQLQQLSRELISLKQQVELISSRSKPRPLTSTPRPLTSTPRPLTSTPRPLTSNSTTSTPLPSSQQEHATRSEPASNNVPVQTNIHSELTERIKVAIGHERKLSGAARKAMMEVFSTQQLTSCTMKGQHTSKFLENPRPGLPSVERDAIKDVLRKRFEVPADDVKRSMRTILRGFEAAYRGLDVWELFVIQGCRAIPTEELCPLLKVYIVLCC